MSTAVEKVLNTVLADAIVFYQKLHHYHWRVEGMNFFGLHAKFEELYDQWAEVMDDVAERILSIKGTPLATLKEALELTTLKEDSSVPSGLVMVENILGDMQKQAGNMRQAIEQAEAAEDRGTANLLDGFCDSIEKTSWMLRAFLKGK